MTNVMIIVVMMPMMVLEAAMMAPSACHPVEVDITVDNDDDDGGTPSLSVLQSC